MSQPAKRSSLATLWVLLGVPLGWGLLALLWFASAPFRTENPDTGELIAHSIEPVIPGVEHPYGPGFYSATVWFNDHAGAFDVKARINIGPGNPMFQDLGVLATFTDVQTAQQTFGTIAWNATGVTIGTGPKAISVPRTRYQTHR